MGRVEAARNHEGMFRLVAVNVVVESPRRLRPNRRRRRKRPIFKNRQSLRCIGKYFAKNRERARGKERSSGA